MRKAGSDAELYGRLAAKYETRSIRGWVFLGIFSLVFALYVLMQSSALVFGPRLRVDAPTDGATIKGAVEIRGVADPDARVTIDRYEVFSDAEGVFAIKLPLTPGFHALTIATTNRFGDSAQVTRNIIVTDADIVIP